jgi:hypothetical protein
MLELRNVLYPGIRIGDSLPLILIKRSQIIHSVCATHSSTVHSRCVSVTRFSDVAKFTSLNTISLTVATSNRIRNCRREYTFRPQLCIRITWKNLRVVLRKVTECLLQFLASNGLGVITFLLSLINSALVISVAILSLCQLINWFN